MDRDCGGRDKATCERLIERLTRWRTRLYCADDYAVYDVLLPVVQLYTGKDETHGIERDNARQRHWLAASAGARSWSRRPSAWWTSALPCSPASLETTGSATSYLCWPKPSVLYPVRVCRRALELHSLRSPCSPA